MNIIMCVRLYYLLILPLLPSNQQFCLFFSDIYFSAKLVSSFQDILDNLFQPLFEVTIDPSSHPELHQFLQHVCKLPC